MAGNSYDVIMVGGGVMGCATAYYLLKAEPQLRVALIEMDPTYTRASTPLSDGNTRLQFNIKENIQMSQYGLEVLKRFAEEMAVEGDKPEVRYEDWMSFWASHSPFKDQSDPAGRTTALVVR